MRVIDGAEDWTADAAMVDADRWDCRLRTRRSWSWTRAKSSWVPGHAVLLQRDHRRVVLDWRARARDARLSCAPRRGRARTSDGAANFDADVEDMFMWTRPAAAMLMHSQDNAHFNHERAAPTPFSADAGVSWNFSAREAWPTHLARRLLLDKLAKRQRPSLAFDDAGRRRTC